MRDVAYWRARQRQLAESGAAAERTLGRDADVSRVGRGVRRLQAVSQTRAICARKELHRRMQARHAPQQGCDGGLDAKASAEGRLSGKDACSAR